jgi:hypothetical protein
MMSTVEKDDHLHVLKVMVDTASAVFTIGALLNWLPAVAAVLSIIWYCIRIWESRTVQTWVGRNKDDYNG